MLSKTFSKEKAEVQSHFPAQFYKRFKEEILFILHKDFQKIQEKILPDLFYEINIILLAQLVKDIIRKLQAIVDLGTIIFLFLKVQQYIRKGYTSSLTEVYVEI